MICLKIVFLGPSRDWAGAEEATVDVPDGATVSELRVAIVKRFPGLQKAMTATRLAVNESFVPNDHPLSAGDEIALIPPVSGGSDADGVMVDLVSQPIAMDPIRKFVGGDPSLGGIVTFEGTTRREQHETLGPLEHLAYEAYESMARKQLVLIASQAKERWSAGRVAIVHRLGIVSPGEVSVIIAVACPHRAEAFDACRWLIDSLKRDVPIWKKNVYAGGTERWVSPPPPDDGGSG